MKNVQFMIYFLFGIYLPIASSLRLFYYSRKQKQPQMEQQSDQITN